VDGREGLRLRPLDRIDFEKRDYIPYSGWPFDKSHLDPYYDRANEFFRLDRSTYDVEDWETSNSPRLPIDADGPVETVMFQHGPKDPVWRDYKEWINSEKKVSVLAHTYTTDIELRSGGKEVKSVKVSCLSDKEFRVTARVFILACGGLEVPRLLLASNSVHSDGLGNQNDLVGRFFMEHLHLRSGVFIPSHNDLSQRLRLYSWHKVNGSGVMGKLSLKEEVIREKEILNYCTFLEPSDSTDVNTRQNTHNNTKGWVSLRLILAALRNRKLPDKLGHHFGNIASDAKPIASHIFLDRLGLRQFARKWRPDSNGGDSSQPVALRLHNMTEQVPNPSSRVQLSNNTNAFGQRQVKLDWKLSEIDIYTITEAQRILADEISRAGIGQLRVEKFDKIPPSGIWGGNHHMGTTRMHTNPRQGVVDENCRIHGVSNLFVAGSSVFPTSGYANPTLTIVALAIRLADHLKEQLRAS